MLYEFTQQGPSARQPFDEDADDELIRRISRRDQRALQLLMVRHRPLLWKVINRCVANPAESEEIVQQCFLLLWERADEYNPARGRVVAWLVTLCQRSAIDALRRRETYERCKERYAAHSHDERDAWHSSNVASANESAAILSRLINQLPAAQREVVHLIFFRGMSQRQVAEYTCTPIGTIKTRIELALRKLRKAAASIGSSGEEFY